MQKRGEYQNATDTYNENYQKIQERERDAQKQQQDLDEEERSMILKEKQKNNIFKRIAEAIKAGFSQWKNARKAKKEYKNENDSLREQRKQNEQMKNASIKIQEELKTRGIDTAEIDKVIQHFEEEEGQMTQKQGTRHQQYTEELRNNATIQEAEENLKEFMEIKGIKEQETDDDTQINDDDLEL